MKSLDHVGSDEATFLSERLLSDANDLNVGVLPTSRLNQLLRSVARLQFDIEDELRERLVAAVVRSSSSGRLRS